MAIFSVRDEERVGYHHSPECCSLEYQGTVVSGRNSPCPRSRPQPRGSLHPVFWEEGSVLRPFANLVPLQGAIPAFELLEAQLVRCSGLCPSALSSPPSQILILKTFLYIRPAHKSVRASFPENTRWNTINFLRSTIFLITAFLRMRIEIISKTRPYFRNVHIERMCFLHSRRCAVRVHESAVIACCVITLAVTNNLKQLESFHWSHYLKKG